MARLILAAFAALCVVHVQASTANDAQYVAAVVDYAPVPYDESLSPEEVAMKNIEAMKGFMAKAKEQNVDIIVFPEEGLRGLLAKSFPMEKVPAADDNVTPCEVQDSPRPLRELSCLAANHGMYLVVNLVHQVPCTKDLDGKCPSRGYYNYNTNVAFDRKGKIVARYHKYNLFGEADNNVPPTVEYVTFDTDFGVRFGMFICFDILFDQPAAQLARVHDVTDFVFSAAWFSEVPFLSAVQAHSAWAHALNVTLLAAGLNDPGSGSTGSGIYHGRHGILEYAFNPRTESTLLVSSVPKREHWQDNYVTPLPYKDRLDPVKNYASSTSDPYDLVKSLRMIQDNLTMYTTMVLPRPAVDSAEQWSRAISMNGFKCTVYSMATGMTLHPMRSAAASIHGASSRARQIAAANALEADDEAVDGDGLHYRLVAFDGVRDHSGVATTGVQVCGIISCRNEKLSSCGWNVPKLNEPKVTWTEFTTLRVTAEYSRTDTLQIASTQAGPRYDPLPAYMYAFTSSNGSTPETQQISLTMRTPVADLRTFAIYGRNFARDGQTPT